MKLDSSRIRQISSAIDTERLWARHFELSRIGARADGGVNRQALSGEDGAARVQLIKWSREHGYEVSTDAIGNIFVRRPGGDPSLPPVLAGSHLDTQPAGGRFDGAFGVLATLEALHAMDACGLESLRPVELVSWTNEEGSRFSPGTMGSSLFAGSLALETLRQTTDSQGIRLGDALNEVMAMIADVPLRPFGFPVAAYLEPHIEQGPILEAAGSSIGIVSGIQGVQWFTVDVVGAEAHAGTTPRQVRKDALQTAVSIIAEMNSVMHDSSDLLRFTVGRLVVEPNSPNTIPARVQFSIDLRHPDLGELDSYAMRVPEICKRLENGCKVSLAGTLRMSPVRFDAGLMDILRDVSETLLLPHRNLTSGAFHDSKSLSAVCPTGMLFIPCERGISHSPQESVKKEDVAAGARVIAPVLAELSLMDDRAFAAMRASSRQNERMTE